MTGVQTCAFRSGGDTHTVLQEDGVHTGCVGGPCPALGVGDPALWSQQGWWVHRGARSQEEKLQALGGERSDTSIQEGFLEGVALNREDEIEAHIV